MKKFAFVFCVTMTIISGLVLVGLCAFFVIDSCARGAEAIGMPDIVGALFGLALCFSALVGFSFAAAGDEDDPL